MDKKFESINNRIFLFKKRLREEEIFDKFCNDKFFSVYEELRKIKDLKEKNMK